MESCDDNLMNLTEIFPVEPGSGGVGLNHSSTQSQSQLLSDLVINQVLNFDSKQLIPGMAGLGKTSIAHSAFLDSQRKSFSQLCGSISAERTSALVRNKQVSMESETVVIPGGGTTISHSLFNTSESRKSFTRDDCMTKVKGNVADDSENQSSGSGLTTEATAGSPPLQDPSGASNRNKKKRLNKRGKTKAKREVSDDDLLRSSCCLLYMFASMYTGGYLLYRIDALEHTRKSHGNNELLPLLVFGPHILPVAFCTLVHLGHYIYFVGEKPCDVFKIRKHDLNNLTPSEDNLGLEYLIPFKQPMQGPKRSPLVFVADDNLYVISKDYSCQSHEFEKYSPAYDSWTGMNPKPKGHGPLKSHVVLDNVAYFATTDETVLSCNLTDGSWSIVSTASKYPRTFCDIHPAFDAPVVIVGNMILGAFKLPSDFNITVAASPHSRYDEFVKNRFMRPTLAPDSKFWPEFARRFDYIRNNESHGSHYMTALQTLDGQNILCFVSYGSNPSIDEPHRSYALLTFYKILGDHWKTSVRLKEEVLEGGDAFCYYSRQVEAGNAIKSYFKSEFLQRKLFSIMTPKLHSTGKLITCLAY